MLWCLHGFLGEGNDWNGFDFGCSVKTPNLFARPLESLNLPEWGSSFSRMVAAIDPEPIVLGYSLGGRLALHALLAMPEVWRAVVIVSAHLGLSTPAERAARVESDEIWARRFLRDSWKQLVDEWNQQPIFGGKQLLARRAEDAFCREALAFSLRSWSLGRQDDLTRHVRHISCPVLMIAGENDASGCEQVQRAQPFLSCGEVWIAPQSFHRVPWERSHEFVGRVRQFLQEVKHGSRAVASDQNI